MLRDLRHALRTLARSPGYTSTVILTLALGIGGTTAVFSVFRSVILQPLAWAPTDRVMLVVERDSAANIRLASYPTFQDWRAGTNAFEAMAFVRGLGKVMKTADGAERLIGAFVSDDYFRVVPEAAAVGRTLEPSDFAPGAPAVVALSWPLWQRRFGGDRSVIGRSVTFGERSYAVVGVMPVGFVYPVWADLWAPINSILATDPALQQRALHVDSRVVGRLRAGVDSAAGARALSAVAAHLAEVYPAESRGWPNVAFQPVAEEVLGGTGPQLRLLTAAAVFVLLIACVNIAALALARAGARSRELAIRSALGGGRGAMLRLLAAESVVLGLAAGALGLGAAVALVRWLRVAGRDLVPRTGELAVDPRAMAAAVVLAIAIVVALGLIPALGRSGPLTVALREGGGGGRGPSRRRLRAALVVGEIALALVLLTGAGLLIRSLERLQRVRTGFDQDRLVAVPVEPPSPRYDSPERALQLYRDVAAAVAAVPGVQAAALSNQVPLSGASINSAIEVEGAPAGPADESDEVLFREVDSAYFRTLGIPIVRGRDFTPEDMRSPGDAMLVNQALAARYWPGGDPIGKRITVYKSAQGRPEFGQPVRGTIVGVVGNVRHFSLDTDFAPEVYLPYTLTVWPRMSVIARTAGDPESLIPTLARAVRAVDPDIPLEGARLWSRVYDLKASLRESLAYRRFITGLLAAFALPALLLAALGIYGVVAYLVTQRGHELGIRMALGAQRGDVLALVLGEGMRLACIGVALGAAGAIATTRWLRSELYETSATDPVTFVLAAVVLAVIGAAATLVPARRATAIDPARALQAE
ncbi:MAG: ABC transporter permease [Gemmatimonadales bacterium]